MGQVAFRYLVGFSNYTQKYIPDTKEEHRHYYTERGTCAGAPKTTLVSLPSSIVKIAQTYRELASVSMN
jgi:hypothetical protein